MSEVVDAPEGNDRRLNRMVATTVVALSVVKAVGKIKDDNIVQAMQADQASKIDLRNKYQATRIKAHDRDIQAALLTRLAPAAPEISAATGESRHYQAEARDLRAKAEAAARDYDVQRRRDDQFDLSDGFLSIAVAIAAIAALVESLAVLGVSWVSAGFAGLPIHPNALVAFLT